MGLHACLLLLTLCFHALPGEGAEGALTVRTPGPYRLALHGLRDADDAGVWAQEDGAPPVASVPSFLVAACDACVCTCCAWRRHVPTSRCSDPFVHHRTHAPAHPCLSFLPTPTLRLRAAEATAAAAEDGRGALGRGPRASFPALFACLTREPVAPPETALLLYLVLHDGGDFRGYCLARTDPEALLLPLLGALQREDAGRGDRGAVYVLLTLLLAFSSDAGWAAALHRVWLEVRGWQGGGLGGWGAGGAGDWARKELPCFAGRAVGEGQR